MKKYSELREQVSRLIEAELSEFWDKLSSKGIIILVISVAASMAAMSLTFILSGQLISAVLLPVGLGCLLALEVLISMSEKCHLRGIIAEYREKDRCDKQLSQEDPAGEECVEEKPAEEKPIEK